ncbi:MAG: MoaA/NifB/PqqE/SkfB family radical SAM enzyme [Candidatus Paceibacteria bacterium]|jgi:MoaA/NifB/PqqE/SkfB family radical SAM enzyme
MMISMAGRMLRSTDKRVLWKFAYNFGWKGMLSVQKFKRRLKQGQVFPPFLYVSIINSCNLRCTGCWVDVAAPREMISLEDWNKLVNNAKKHGNRFFGILGGEPLMHPNLIEMLEAHPDCYFQIFTNGHPMTDHMAAELRRVGNATPLISVEGMQQVSDERRGRTGVLDKTLLGIQAAVKARLITGVASSICQTNYDELVNEAWVDRLIELGVHYNWFHTYRAVGPDASPELALSPEQQLRVRNFAVEMRNEKPIGFVDAYWDDEGRALCPAATGISHHISPYGDIEPCPIVQFANESIHDNDGDIFKTMTQSTLLADFRKTAAGATRGCIVLERPDLLKEVVERNGSRDTTARGTAMAELNAMDRLSSQHNPGNEVREKHWMYRFAKKHWFFGFGAYT